MRVDFIITSASKEVLETKVKPTVESFLRERGLERSRENITLEPKQHQSKNAQFRTLLSLLAL